MFAGNFLQLLGVVWCYYKNWRSFMKVLDVKCYLDCRFTRVLFVNTSKVEGP